jgi:Leucine-rich repeat (LRR) protein
MRDIGSVFSPVTFPHLAELDLSSNLLTSLVGLKHLPALHVLRASNNRLNLCSGGLFDDDTGPCSTSNNNGNTQPQLTSEASVVAPPPCAILPNLQVLVLADNRLSTLDVLPLAQLTSLRSLFLQNNVLQRLEGIGALQQLEELVRAFSFRLRLPMLCLLCVHALVIF